MSKKLIGRKLLPSLIAKEYERPTDNGFIFRDHLVVVYQGKLVACMYLGEVFDDYKEDFSKYEGVEIPHSLLKIISAASECRIMQHAEGAIHVTVKTKDNIGVEEVLSMTPNESITAILKTALAEPGEPLKEDFFGMRSYGKAILTAASMLDGSICMRNVQVGRTKYTRISFHGNDSITFSMVTLPLLTFELPPLERHMREKQESESEPEPEEFEETESADDDYESAESYAARTGTVHIVIPSRLQMYLAYGEMEHATESDVRALNAYTEGLEFSGVMGEEYYGKDEVLEERGSVIDSFWRAVPR